MWTRLRRGHNRMSEPAGRLGNDPDRSLASSGVGLLALLHNPSPPGLHVGGLWVENRRPGKEPTQVVGEHVNFTRKGSRLICEPWTRSAEHIYLLCLVKAIGFHCACFGRHSSQCRCFCSAGHRPQLAEADDDLSSVVTRHHRSRGGLNSRKSA